jgi:RNA methyltransferase, TrmH family
VSLCHRDEHIVSAANPTVKLARSLLRRRVRHRERAILVEGFRAISTAVHQGATIRAVMIDAGRQEQVTGQQLLELRSAVSRILFIAPELFKSVADTEHPQPIIAICDMPETELPSSSTFVLAIDSLRDPGNLGTLIRAAAAAGVDAVALLHGTVDVFNPKTIRASAGAVFSIPIGSFPDIAHVVEQCFSSHPAIVIADGAGEQDYDTIDWTAPSLLIIGGEAEGAGKASRTYADVVARIPIETGVESLNAALAGGIILFEARRQRDTKRRNVRTDADSALG